MTARLTGISSMATRQILAELADAYRNETGRPVAIQSIGGVDAARRIRTGEIFDIVVLADGALRKLEADGHLKPGSRTGFAVSAMAVACRSGAKHPDLTNEDTVKSAILAAQSISYSTGPSGDHLIKLLEKWGIRQQLSGRLLLAQPGVPVANVVARGEAEIGFQQFSEVLDVPGIDIAGPLPPEIQALTLFSCAVGAYTTHGADAQHLIDYLTSAKADDCKRRRGMEPGRTA